MAAIGHLNDIADASAEQTDVRFISVSDEQLDTVSAFLARKPIHTWIGLDQQQTLHKVFGISGIPKTIIINQEGRVAAKISPTQLDSTVLSRIKKGELVEADSPRTATVAGVDPDGSNANQGLMQIILRESTSPITGLSGTVSGTKSTLLGYDAAQLIMHAFGLSPTRAEIVAELPKTKFDLITRFPKSSEDEKDIVQAAVASALGVKLRHEQRDVDVFVVSIPEDGKHSLSPSVSTGGSSFDVNQSGINAVNARLSNILYSIENMLQHPVIDETGLDGSYDVVVTWNKGDAPEQIVQSFTDATGLALTGTQREIEFAVIENR